VLLLICLSPTAGLHVTKCDWVWDDVGRCNCVFWWLFLVHQEIGISRHLVPVVKSFRHPKNEVQHCDTGPKPCTHQSHWKPRRDWGMSLWNFVDLFAGSARHVSRIDSHRPNKSHWLHRSLILWTSACRFWKSFLARAPFQPEVFVLSPQMSKVFSEIFIFKYIYIHYIRTLKKLHVKDCAFLIWKVFVSVLYSLLPAWGMLRRTGRAADTDPETRADLQYLAVFLYWLQSHSFSGACAPRA
jgi:hypothetical protein